MRKLSGEARKSPRYSDRDDFVWRAVTQTMQESQEFLRQKRKDAHLDVTSLRARTEQRRAGAAERRSPWVSWRCSRRRTRRIWSGSGSPRCARRCGAWTARSEVRSRRERVGDAAHSPEGASEPCTDDVTTERARSRSARRAVCATNTTRRPTPDRRTLTTDPPPTDPPHVPRRHRHPARGEGCPEIHQGLR
jgi:hypothetical protein